MHIHILLKRQIHATRLIISLFHRYNLYEKINYEEQRLNIYCLLHDSYAM